jgi:hypothetical protein
MLTGFLDAVSNDVLHCLSVTHCSSADGSNNGRGLFVGMRDEKSSVLLKKRSAPLQAKLRILRCTVRM